MIFLVEYDQKKGELVSLREFDVSQRQRAQDARQDCELELTRRQVDHEVVLLEAENEAAIRRTHRRYFENLRQLLKSGNGASTGPDIEPASK